MCTNLLPCHLILKNFLFILSKYPTKVTHIMKLKDKCSQQALKIAYPCYCLSERNV